MTPSLKEEEEMATCTGFCFFGLTHRDGGIQVMHMVRLYEHFRATLVMEERMDSNPTWRRLAIWDCSAPEAAIDELMLMGAVFALKDQAVIEACQATGMTDTSDGTRWRLSEVGDRLPQLYEMARQAYERAAVPDGGVGPKIALTAYDQSLFGNFEALKPYRIAKELCRSVFVEGQAAWI